MDHDCATHVCGYTAGKSLLTTVKFQVKRPMKEQRRLEAEAALEEEGYKIVSNEG